MKSSVGKGGTTIFGTFIVELPRIVGACSIVTSILFKVVKKGGVDIQTQVVDKQVFLARTEAGKVLLKEAHERCKHLETDLRRVCGEKEYKETLKNLEEKKQI